MKRSLLLALPLLCAQVASAQSAVPSAISYQGRVSDANGVPVGDTNPVNREVTLRIYDSTSAATSLYSEKQTVTINKGIFSVLLGQGLQVGSEPRPAIATVFNGSERFLGITVDDGSAAADPEITPRQQIVSTAFAFTSKSAETAGSVQQSSGSSNMNTLTLNTITVNGASKINGNNVFELGAGVAKGLDNGSISYARFSTGLDIIGAGATQAERRITMHAQAGTTFLGPVFWNTANGGLGQHLNLFGAAYGTGIQTNTFYNRAGTGGHFAWYLGGTHGNSELDAGGGQNLAVLNGNGLTVNTGSIRINGGGTFEGILDTVNHSVFAQSAGGAHSFGSQDFTTFSRTSEQFAWYLGGAYSVDKLNPGGGSTLAILNNDGFDLKRGAVIGGNLTANGNFSTSGNCTIGGDELRIGANRPGQQLDAGKLAYGQFGFNGLSVIGGGTTASNRAIKMWAEDGTFFTGAVIVDGANYGYNIPADSDNYASNGGGQNVANGASVSDVSIKATSGRVVASVFTAVSDARIKKIIGVSDAARDLETLMKVQVTDYTKKDDESVKPKAFKKVIAQQVESVFPQAVSTMQDAVPDMLTTVSAKDGWITLTKALPAALEKGDVLKVWRPNPQGNGTGAILSTVTEVKKDGFQLADKLTGRIFLYGHQVDDLRSVDYEAIAMLNVSATQELHRTIEAKEAEIAALKKELAAAKEANTLQDTRLVAIEKALELKAPASAPAKKETKVASRR